MIKAWLRRRRELRLAQIRAEYNELMRIHKATNTTSIWMIEQQIIKQGQIARIERQLA